MYISKYHHTKLLKRILFRMRRQPRGQSFLELILVVTILALMLAGMVEFGFMLNNYLHVLDGSREAARFSSTSNPFNLDATGVDISSYYKPPFYYQAAAKAAQTMFPVTLNPENPDDIVISVFSMHGTTPTRFPENPSSDSLEVNPDPGVDGGGWSLCSHYGANDEDAAANPPYGGFAAYWGTLNPPASIPTELSDPGWAAGDCTAQSSQFDDGNITDIIGSLNPPSTGFVLVEIFYNYPQLLKLPVLTNVLPDPIPLSVYSIMPLSSAQPTQVH